MRMKYSFSSGALARTRPATAETRARGRSLAAHRAEPFARVTGRVTRQGGAPRCQRDVKDLSIEPDHNHGRPGIGRQWPEDFPQTALLPQQSDRRITLMIPADPRLLSLARLCVAGVAAAAAARIDEIDDLRMAVTEACQWLSTAGPGRLEVAIDSGSGQIEACVSRCDGPFSSPLVEPSELSKTILRSTVDHFEMVMDPLRPRCFFEKTWQSAR